MLLKLCASFQSHQWIQTELQSRNARFGSKLMIFLSCVPLKIDGWPWKTMGHLFYATSSFVHHFVATCELKLELRSGNAQIGAKIILTSATLTFCVDITSVNSNYSWKFHDDTTRGTLWKRCDRQMDGENCSWSCLVAVKNTVVKFKMRIPLLVRLLLYTEMALRFNELYCIAYQLGWEQILVASRDRGSAHITAWEVPPWRRPVHVLLPSYYWLAPVWGTQINGLDGYRLRLINWSLQTAGIMACPVPPPSLKHQQPARITYLHVTYSLY